jgi:hypothetical protein
MAWKYKPKAAMQSIALTSWRLFIRNFFYFSVILACIFSKKNIHERIHNSFPQLRISEYLIENFKQSETKNSYQSKDSGLNIGATGEVSDYCPAVVADNKSNEYPTHCLYPLCLFNWHTLLSLLAHLKRNLYAKPRHKGKQPSQGLPVQGLRLQKVYSL